MEIAFLGHVVESHGVGRPMNVRGSPMRFPWHAVSWKPCENVVEVSRESNANFVAISYLIEAHGIIVLWKLHASLRQVSRESHDLGS